MRVAVRTTATMASPPPRGVGTECRAAGIGDIEVGRAPVRAADQRRAAAVVSPVTRNAAISADNMLPPAEPRRRTRQFFLEHVRCQPSTRRAFSADTRRAAELVERRGGTAELRDACAWARRGTRAPDVAAPRRSSATTLASNGGPARGRNSWPAAAECSTQRASSAARLSTPMRLRRFSTAASGSGKPESTMVMSLRKFPLTPAPYTIDGRTTTSSSAPLAAVVSACSARSFDRA